MIKEKLINPFTDTALNCIYTDEEIEAFTPEQREYYIRCCEAYRDYNNTIYSAAKKAQEDGREKGREEEKRNVARRMLEMNADINFIATVAELSVDEVLKIKEELKQ